MSEIKTLNGYAFADTKARESLGQMDIPKVFIDGMIPTTKDDVLAEMTYISKTETFHAYLKIKCQGSSSMSYPKKNFTVNLYSDEARETKLKKVFRDWGVESSKFVLKANYIDHSHARNIVCANLWDEVVSSRADYDTLPVELRNSPRNGAIDGFPIKVYTNGTYQGIYTWNIGKDAWMWGMNEDNPKHVLMCGETNTDGVYAENACNFRALWSGTDGDAWSVEVGTNSNALKTSLNNLIACVKDTDDATFKAAIGNYLDVQSAIDYYIHQYVICGLDGLAKNMLLGTYDGTHWMCGAYDMDSTFGLYFDGGSFVSTAYKCPEEYQEKYSLLWSRMETVFSEELKERYAELRTIVYTFPNIVSRFERFVDVIGRELYAEDLTAYPGIPSGDTNNIQQLRNYIRDRLAYCDEQFETMGEVVEPNVLYRLPQETVFNGADTVIDTDVQLFDTAKDFTIVLDFTLDPECERNMSLLSCTYGTDYEYHGGIDIRVNPWSAEGITEVMPMGVPSNGGANWANNLNITARSKMALVYENGVGSLAYYKGGDGAVTNGGRINSDDWVYTQHDGVLKLGYRLEGVDRFYYAKCTFHSLVVYDYAFSTEEIIAALNG